MKHNWEKDENGNVNEWAWEANSHNGVFCVDCGKSVCVHCDPNYMELDDCTGPQKSKSMTNADRIRAMSDEELAAYLAEISGGTILKTYKQLGLSLSDEKSKKYLNELTAEYLKRLQQPAEEDT